MSQRIIFIVTSVVLGIGCNHTAPIKETSIQPPAAKPEQNVSIDNTILNLVLSDLRMDKSPDCPLTLSRDVPREIFFSTEMIDAVPQPTKPLERDELWSHMTESQIRLTQEGIKNLEERYAAGDSFRDFRSTRDTMHVIDTAPNIDTTANDAPYGARFPIRAWVPGYSQDGSCVVLHLYFPDVLHPSYATYVLMSTNGNWKIAFRGFVTYA
jgi:hypothetical protein